MSALFSTTDICERALRKIGSFSINDSAADPEELQEAAYWLDMSVAEMVATERCTWLIPDTITLALTADTASYVLSTIMGTSYPTDGFLFVIEAYLTDGGTDQPINIMRRREYEDISKKTAGGRPEGVYIDRLSAKTEQKIYVYPVPSDATLSLKLVIQKQSPDLSPRAGVRHGFQVAWQRWLVLATAAEIGDGPVRRLPSGETDRTRRDAEMAFRKLQSSFNRETHRSRRVKPHGV